MCLNLGVNINIIKKSLKNFSGVQRRIFFSKNNTDFYDDYAHHNRNRVYFGGVKNVYKDRNIISIFELGIQE